MKGTRSKEYKLSGLVFTYSDPKELPPDKGRNKTRWESIITSRIEGTKKKLFDLKRIRSGTEESICARIESRTDVFQILRIDENINKINTLAGEKAIRMSALLFLICNTDGIMLSSYPGLKQPTLDMLLSGENTMLALDEIYLDAPESLNMVQIKLKSALRADKTKDTNVALTGLLALLSAVFAEAMKHGLADVNPYGHRANIRSAQAEIIEKMSRRSLSDAESAAFLTKCLEGLASGNLIYGLILVCFLLGLTIYESRALEWRDWQTIGEGNISWLCVTKELYQKRGKAANLRYKLRSLFQYRKMPCTEEVEMILRACMSIHFSEGKTELTGLIFHDADGKHIQPERVKKLINQMLDGILPHEGLNLEGMNTRFGKKDKRAVTRGDILRRNFEYIMRNKSKMEPSEVQALMGISPSDTYAHYYIDWANTDVLMCEREKIERWHKTLAASLSPKTTARLQTTQTLVRARRGDHPEQGQAADDTHSSRAGKEARGLLREARHHEWQRVRHPDGKAA